MSALTYDSVHNAARAALYDEGHAPAGVVPEGAVVVEGIVRTFAFEPDRLEAQRELVRELIEELPAEFLTERAGGGGGWTFLNLPTTKKSWIAGDPEEGGIWGQQLDAELLYALAAGLGMARFQLPRDMWSVLPGGVPYIVFDPDGLDAAAKPS